MGRRKALLGDLRSLLPYLIAGALFIIVGLIDPRFMLNWAPGIALLLAVVWVVPALWKRRPRR
ncbi:MAG: hypothetical protein ACKVT1_11745 [Dehalococcoidia bacterium]